MFDALFTWLQAITLAGGAWGVFAIAFAQELIPPIPSTLVTFASGALFLGSEALTYATFMKLVWSVGIPVAAGMTLGATIVYGIVYWGGAPLVKRFGHHIALSWSDIERLQQRLKGTAADEVLLFVARAFPLTPSILLNVVCGLIRWNPIAFVVSTFFGTIIRATWSGFIGWQLGAALAHYAELIERANMIIFIVVCLAFVGFFIYRKKRAVSEKSEAAQSSNNPTEITS